MLLSGRTLMKRVAWVGRIRPDFELRLFLEILLAILFVIATGASVRSQQSGPAPQAPSPGQKPSPQATPPPQPTPASQPTPFLVPSLPGPSPAAATPSPAASPPPVSLLTQTDQSLNPLTLEEALRLANVQSSSFQIATLNERIAAEDVKQAQAAFLPKVSTPLSYIYTSPALGLKPGEPRTQSFIANNAISEHQAFANVEGDFDIAGKLRETLAKNRALLAAAPAGTEVARGALVQAEIEPYYGSDLAV